MTILFVDEVLFCKCVASIFKLTKMGMFKHHFPAFPVLVYIVQTFNLVLWVNKLANETLTSLFFLLSFQFVRTARVKHVEPSHFKWRAYKRAGFVLGEEYPQNCL